MATKEKGGKPAGGLTEKFNELNQIFGTRPLARMLRTQTAHLLAFDAGDQVLGGRSAERLNFLFGVVGHLKGSFNANGINSWFDRPRGLLAHKTPRQALQASAWRAKDSCSKRIRKLARETAAFTRPS